MFNKFLTEHKEFGEIACWEKPLYCPNLGVCGTPDIVFEKAIVDIKRTFYNARYHSLQLAGYQALCEANQLVERGCTWHFILVLHEDKYQLFNVYNSMARTYFMSLVTKYKIEKNIERYLDER
jgi:hypothetical protein